MYGGVTNDCAILDSIVSAIFFTWCIPIIHHCNIIFIQFFSIYYIIPVSYIFVSFMHVNVSALIMCYFRASKVA